MRARDCFNRHSRSQQPGKKSFKGKKRMREKYEGRKEGKGGLTLKMESLLVYSDGESAIVFVIDSNHRSLSKQNGVRDCQTEGHVILSRFFCSAPSQTHTQTRTRSHTERRGRKGGAWDVGTRKREEEDHGDGKGKLKSGWGNWELQNWTHLQLFHQHSSYRRSYQTKFK